MLTGQSGNDSNILRIFFFLPLSESLLMTCLILNQTYRSWSWSLLRFFKLSFRVLPWDETAVASVKYTGPLIC